MKLWIFRNNEKGKMNKKQESCGHEGQRNWNLEHIDHIDITVKLRLSLDALKKMQTLGNCFKNKNE